MKKILIISLISIVLNLASVTIYKSPYPYIPAAKCESEKMGGCYDVTLAKGFPLGYLPIQTSSAFDDFNSEFDFKNFFLNFIFYYMIINVGLNLYKLNKKQGCH